jgi:excinuclease ABC subunit A
MMEKPDVDQIDGLSPAISIDQKSTSRNPRSTVATVTEIYDYLRLMFARIGIPHCPECGKAVARTTAQHVIDAIANLGADKKLLILAPVVNQKKGEFAHVPEQYQKLGFARARVDGVLYALDEFPELEKSYKHTIEIVVDRLVNSPDNISRLSQSVEQAFGLADRPALRAGLVDRDAGPAGGARRGDGLGRLTRRSEQPALPLHSQGRTLGAVGGEPLDGERVEQGLACLGGGHQECPGWSRNPRLA